MICAHCHVANPDEARFCAACGKATSTTEPLTASTGGVPAAAAARPEPIGREIAGRYRIQSKLGEGGMGAVYKAEQISLKRTCAVKLLRPEVGGMSIMLRRFNAEAEAVAKLSHPNIVNIYDFGQDADGTLYIAMEYVEGRSLRAVIQSEAPLSLHRALAIASQVAASLVDAHAQSIIHRDLKPDNVMLQTRGRQRDVVRVLDFGIAKLRDEGRATQAAMTQAGDMLGTPQYMAPEQIRAEQIDGRTDVYALGCLIYEMVTGRMPFEGTTVLAILSKHLTETPPPPSQRRPDLGLPRVIDELVMSALAKDRNHRPATMEAFADRINAVLATIPGESSPLTAQQPVATPPAGVAYVPTPPVHQAPHVPPPGGFAPHVPPPVTPPPAGPYGAPVPPPPPVRPASGGSGNRTLLIALVATVLLGGVIAIALVARGGDKTEDAPVEHHDDDVVMTPDPAQEPAAKKDEWDTGGTPAATTTPPALDKLLALKDKICACTDSTCAVRVTAEMQGLSLELAKLELDEANTAKLQAAIDGFSQCAAAHMGSTPAPPPDKPKGLEAQIEAIADRACKCSDATCGRAVLADAIEFIKRNANAENIDQTRSHAAGERMGKCLVNAGMDPQEILNAFQAISGG